MLQPEVDSYVKSKKPWVYDDSVKHTHKLKHEDYSFQQKDTKTKYNKFRKKFPCIMHVIVSRRTTHFQILI